MKTLNLSKLTLALVAAAAASIASTSANAGAGITVSPLLLGYHYSDLDKTNDKQREVLTTGKNLNTNQNTGNNNSSTNNPNNGGVTKVSGLYTGAALGVEITPSTQFQVEYGVANNDGRASKASWDMQNPNNNNAYDNRFDVEQRMISGNFLIGTEQFTGHNPDSKLKPYVLIGAGQSRIKVENQAQYTADATNEYVNKGDIVKAGTLVSESTDTIGNLGLGAMYRINDTVSLRGEARAIHNFDNDWWEGMALAGMEVVLGGHRGTALPVPPKVEPVVEEVVETAPTVITEPVNVDSDGDGVPDNLDACPNTPSNRVVDARGCPEKEVRRENISAELRIQFDNDKSNIKPQYKPEIAKAAQVMRENDTVSATIEGHASKTGPSAKYNQRLSEARANAVKSVLVNEYGIAPNRVSAVGYGYSRPLQGIPANSPLNRRVQAVFNGYADEVIEKTKDGQ